jgi:hypothetical protein
MVVHISPVRQAQSPFQEEPAAWKWSIRLAAHMGADIDSKTPGPIKRVEPTWVFRKCEGREKGIP